MMLGMYQEIRITQTLTQSLILVECFESCFPKAEKMAKKYNLWEESTGPFRGFMDLIAWEFVPALRPKIADFYRIRGKQIIEIYSEAQISYFESIILSGLEFMRQKNMKFNLDKKYPSLKESKRRR